VATPPDAMGDAVAIIPARLASERFPGKVLADDTGSPLVWHVVEQTRLASSVSRVVVATDSRRVLDAVESLGGEGVMTSADHPNGTSRLAEAARALDLAEQAIVVNVQGDEPEIDPNVIDACVGMLVSSGRDMSTVASPFAADEDPADPNIVKVVARADGRALYFTRALVPYARSGASAQPSKHIGIYAYRRAFLEIYAGLTPTPLEQTERLEQLRALEHGYEIVVATCVARHHGIDTQEQYAAFVARHRARA
jgi:3-deoxy-manno-octulosonate cytidylyltransferase (CMP-KDO synthetase)